MTTITALQMARETVYAFIGADDPEAEGITTRRIMRALNRLDDHGDEDDKALVIRAFRSAPGLTNYDGEGNWCGPIANENGWTA